MMGYYCLIQSLKIVWLVIPALYSHWKLYDGLLLPYTINENSHKQNRYLKIIPRGELFTKHST